MIEKEVESVVRLNLTEPMRIDKFEKLMALQFKDDYERAMSHIVLMREEHLLDQDSHMIYPNFSQRLVNGWRQPKKKKGT